MADPLSIATGVVGLIQASYALTKLLINFIGSVKDAPAKAAIAVSEISEMRAILEQIQSFILRFETADKSRTALIQVDRLVDVISGCVATFSEFEAALDKATKSSMTLVDRAKWVWDEEKIDDLVARLQRHKISLSLLVTILTGETQLAMWNSIERLSAAAEMFNNDRFETSHSTDNESVTSQSTVEPQTDLRSDASSIVTVLHHPRDLDFISEMPRRFEFETDLEKSRPYRTISLEASTSAISITESNERGWSMLSGCSLADISNISILSLYIYLSDLYNPSHYEMSGEDSLPVPSQSEEGGSSQQQVSKKGSRFKYTWKLVLANVRTAQERSTMDAMYHRGLQYHNENKLVEAEAMWRQTLDGYGKVLGREHNLTLYTVSLLGLVYYKQDKLDESEAMCQRALVDFEKTMGLEHELTLKTVHNLGAVYYQQDKLPEAEAMLQRALMGKEKTLELEHESTLYSVHGLGQVYDKQERHEEAEAMYRRALEGCKKVLGPGHELTLLVIDALAMFYRRQGKIEQAEAVERERLRKSSKKL